MKYNKIDFNKKVILITGGAGFIGSNLVYYFQENFPKSKIVVFDCFRNEEKFSNGNLKSLGHYKNLRGFKGEIICGDLKSEKDLHKLNKFNFDYIFHQAAISDTRVDDQEVIMKTNVNSFYHLLEIAKNNKATFIYASSAATYGSLPSPQSVGKEFPENPYGFSKFMMDQIVYQYINENTEMKIVGLRYFNVYGNREIYKGKTASAVLQFGHQILEKKAPRLFEESNHIFRDFVYIKDVIQANIKACAASKNGIYNVGTGRARSFQDIADILQKVLGTNYGTDYFPNPYVGYQMHTQADISLTEKNLNYSPNWGLEEGINDYLEVIKSSFNERD